MMVKLLGIDLLKETIRINITVLLMAYVDQKKLDAEFSQTNKLRKQGNAELEELLAK